LEDGPAEPLYLCAPHAVLVVQAALPRKLLLAIHAFPRDMVASAETPQPSQEPPTPETGVNRETDPQSQRQLPITHETIVDLETDPHEVSIAHATIVDRETDPQS
jgi:hypothetical protein